jgi:hypothetical protein
LENELITDYSLRCRRQLFRKGGGRGRLRLFSIWREAAWLVY